jgi:hypothetical protein
MQWAQPDGRQSSTRVTCERCLRCWSLSHDQPTYNNGRHLAFLSDNFEANVWTLEDF